MPKINLLSRTQKIKNPHAPRLNVIPRVTRSRRLFIEHIEGASREANILDGLRDEWMRRVESGICEAHYFEGVIFIAKPSPYDILHEVVHHVVRMLKYWTNCGSWHGLDVLADDLDVAVFNRKAERRELRYVSFPI